MGTNSASALSINEQRAAPLRSSDPIKRTRRLAELVCLFSTRHSQLQSSTTNFAHLSGPREGRTKPDNLEKYSIKIRQKMVRHTTKQLHCAQGIVLPH